MVLPMVFLFLAAGCGRQSDRQAAAPAVKLEPQTAAARETNAVAAAAAKTNVPEGSTPALPRPVWTSSPPVTVRESMAVFSRLNPGPILRVPQVGAAPAIDGKLDEVYAAAAPAEFKFLSGGTNPPQGRTLVRLVSTQTNLFIFFECFSPDMSALQATVTQHNGPVWKDDSVEIFLDPLNVRTADSYAQIVINPLGTTAETKASRGRKAPGWNPALRVATAILPDRWTVEVALSFADLRDGPPQRVWAGNFNRLAHLPGGDEDTAWSPTGQSDSHVPDRFGYLWLDAGTIYSSDYAAWGGPRHVFSPTDPPIFRVAPEKPDLILSCREATPNVDKTYWFGGYKLSDNSEALLVVTGDKAVRITTTHGWRPIFARWINAKLLHIECALTLHRVYYCFYDVERSLILLEECDDDGADIWSRLGGQLGPGIAN